MSAANNDDGPPPIEPVHKKTILKNETPEIVSKTAINVFFFFEKYGWFVVLGIIVVVFIWSKLAPYWRKWKEKRDKQIEEQNLDPVRLARTQEHMELSRRQMQEAVNARAAEHAEKMKELEDQKRMEKIDNWQNVQKGRSQKRSLIKRDYNPLTGSSSGSSYRPSGRGNTGGG